MSEKKIPPIIQISYSKGELIIKENNYGISIYKILEGHARVFQGTAEKKTILATLKKGDIFGEMSFFNFGLEARSASVEALDHLLLEVWHPARLTEEYKKTTPMLKYIINQNLKRVLRMNRLVEELSAKKKNETKENSGKAQRKNPRKKWKQGFSYRPADASIEANSHGLIRDVSSRGLGAEISVENTFNFPHETGSNYELDVPFPSGDTYTIKARLAFQKKQPSLNQIILGFEFVSMNRQAAKQLRFLLIS